MWAKVSVFASLVCVQSDPACWACGVEGGVGVAEGRGEHVNGPEIGAMTSVSAVQSQD